jgi:hypothetical protein
MTSAIRSAIFDIAALLALTFIHAGTLPALAPQKSNLAEN